MEFRLPEIGEGLYEAELSRWLVKPGDAVKPGQGLLEVLTDKATMEVPAPFKGTVGELRAEVGRQVKVGDVVLTFEGEPAVAATQHLATHRDGAHRDAMHSTVATAPVAVAVAPPRDAIAVKAAPSVRLMARKLGVDIGNVRGSGPAGRVLIEDLAPMASRPAATPQATATAAPVDYGKPGTRVKFHGVRRMIAEHLTQAKQTIPHYTYVDECDVTDLVRMRASLKDSLGKQGVRITYLAFLVKAVVGALKDIPMVNASLDEQAGEVVLHDGYHIGVAVATPGGLIVPVVRDADRKPLVEIAREVERLRALALAGKAKREDLIGGTFTVTSIGNIGGLFATPIINHPQVGILGVGKIVKRPVFDAHGQLKAADMVYLSLTFDHRVLDGAVGAAFGNALIQRLTNPATLLVD